MFDTLTKYFRMMSKMRHRDTNDLTRKVIMETGLPELLNITSSPSLRTRIQKEISHGIQGNQHAG